MIVTIPFNVLCFTCSRSCACTMPSVLPLFIVHTSSSCYVLTTFPFFLYKFSFTLCFALLCPGEDQVISVELSLVLLTHILVCFYRVKDIHIHNKSALCPMLAVSK